MFALNVAQRVSVVVNLTQVPLNTSAVWIRITAMANMYPSESQPHNC